MIQPRSTNDPYRFRRAEESAFLAIEQWQALKSREELEADRWRVDVFHPVTCYLEFARCGLVEGPLSCDEGKFWVGGRTSGLPNFIGRPIGIEEIRCTVKQIEQQLQILAARNGAAQ